MHLNSMVAWPAVRSKTVVLLLLIHCFMYLPLFVGFCAWSLFRSAILSILSCFCNLLDEEERVGCFALIVFPMPCYCLCSVVFPHGAVGWSEVSDCGIS